MIDSLQRRKILSSYVKRIWSIGCQDYSSSHHQFRFFADGSPGLMFQQAGEPMLINNDRTAANVFLYGQTVNPIVLSTIGRYDITVVTFYPDVVQQLFGIPAHELTDSCVDLSHLAIGRKHALTERMLDAVNEQSRIEVMENFIFDLITGTHKQLDAHIRHATQVIQDTQGNKRISDIARELQFSDRTLCRRFEQHVGVVPKVFSGIVKFQSALQVLEGGKFDSLSGLAFDLGYADQSHFNRSFKAYTGITPLEYLERAKT